MKHNLSSIHVPVLPEITNDEWEKFKNNPGSIASVVKSQYQEQQSFSESIGNLIAALEKQTNEQSKMVGEIQKQLESANATSSSAKIRANLSILIAIGSLMVNFLANLDKIFFNLQRGISYLNLLITGL